MTDAAPQPPPGGARTVLSSLGIPASVLNYRPRLPSRNWLIFLSVTGSILGAYAYDRRECRKIRDEYKARVAHLALEPLATNDFARKITVYACKSPGDEDFSRSERFFRKYLKPVLVSAAVDYEIINGNRYGALAMSIADKIRERRRIAAGIDPEPINFIPLPTQMSPAEKLAREQSAGAVIIGRHTFKEFLAGTVEGWTGSLAKVDREEQLSHELQEDGVFDEPEEDNSSESTPGQKQTVYRPTNLSPLSQLILQTRTPPAKSAIPAELDVPPAHIPQQPPFVLVPFSNLIGFRNIPRMIFDFFNERDRVRLGSAAAFALVQAQTRPFQAPSDLEFDVAQEQEYLASFEAMPDTIEEGRSEFYDKLATKLATARELARGLREPTKDERNYPPKTEVELRTERLKKEQRWRADLRGWSILHRGVPPAWDDRFKGVFSVYIEPTEGS